MHMHTNTQHGGLGRLLEWQELAQVTVSDPLVLPLQVRYLNTCRLRRTTYTQLCLSWQPEFVHDRAAIERPTKRPLHQMLWAQRARHVCGQSLPYCDAVPPCW